MEWGKELERVKINNPKNQRRIVQKKSPHFWGLHRIKNQILK
jgi:hypothetical protein